MNSGSRKRLVTLLVTLGLASFGLAAYSAAELGLIGARPFHGTTYEDAPPAPSFSLTDHLGRLTSLSDFRDRVVLLFFGYTACPDVCPLTLTRLNQLLDEMELGPGEVSVLLITVDPENDTPEKLADYLSRFGVRTIGLTGDLATLQNLFAKYGVYASTVGGHDGHPTLSHTSQVFGIDSAGRLRVLIHADSPPAHIEQDIRALLDLS